MLRIIGMIVTILLSALGFFAYQNHVNMLAQQSPYGCNVALVRNDTTVDLVDTSTHPPTMLTILASNFSDPYFREVGLSPDCRYMVATMGESDQSNIAIVWDLAFKHSQYLSPVHASDEINRFDSIQWIEGGKFAVVHYERSSFLWTPIGERFSIYPHNYTPY